MKNRDYKIFAEGEYYHIYNRGNGKQNIFLDEQDYLNFLKRLKLVLGLTPTRAPLVNNKLQGAPLFARMSPLPSNSFEIVCYCLMPNHFHFLIRQVGDIPISKLISKVCTSYSMYFNRRHKHIGHLFQDRFKSVPVDIDDYLLWLSVYIHQNPKVAGLVKNLEEWQWSSYQDYVGLRHGNLCKKDVVLERFKNVEEYKNFMDSGYELVKEKELCEDLFLDLEE